MAAGARHTHTILKPHDRVALVFIERIKMTDESVFNVSDIVRAAFSPVRKAPTKPQNGPSKPHPYEAFAKDMERLRGDWEKVLGPIVKHWLRQR